MSDSSPVIHTNDLPWTEQAHNAKFRVRRKPLSKAAGNQKLGCSLYELPPGCRAYPYHYHLGNEEAIYVLEGSGTLRLGGEEIAIATGDYVAFPTSESAAHQLINTGDTPLRYLCFSTMSEPDVVAYPDSDKVGIFTGAAPGGAKEQRTLNKFFPADAEVNYWEGETGSQRVF